MLNKWSVVIIGAVRWNLYTDGGGVTNRQLWIISKPFLQDGVFLATNAPL